MSDHDDTDSNPGHSGADELPGGPVEVGGQYALVMPGSLDRVGFQSVSLADLPGLMDAYRTACRLARDAETLFTDAGLAEEVLSVSALVDDSGRPAIQVLLTVAGARRLGQIFTSGSRPPPRQSAA